MSACENRRPNFRRQGLQDTHRRWQKEGTRQVRCQAEGDTSMGTTGGGGPCRWLWPRWSCRHVSALTGAARDLPREGQVHPLAGRGTKCVLILFRREAGSWVGVLEWPSPGFLQAVCGWAPSTQSLLPAPLSFCGGLPQCPTSPTPPMPMADLRLSLESEQSISFRRSCSASVSCARADAHCCLDLCICSSSVLSPFPTHTWSRLPPGKRPSKIAWSLGQSL